MQAGQGRDCGVETVEVTFSIRRLSPEFDIGGEFLYPGADHAMSCSKAEIRVAARGTPPSQSPTRATFNAAALNRPGIPGDSET